MKDIYELHGNAARRVACFVTHKFIGEQGKTLRKHIATKGLLTNQNIWVPTFKT
jgi:hypothetical protein